MMFPNAWLAAEWWIVAVPLILIGLGVAALAYRSTPGSGALRSFLAILKILALVLLAVCLLEPMYQFSRPEPGANLLMVLVDDSQSLQVKGPGDSETRETKIARRLNDDATWLDRLAKTFDVRRYQFDQSLRPVANYSEYAADRSGTDLIGSLQLVAERFGQRPAAGVVMVTDGNDLRGASGLAPESVSEMLQRFDWKRMPPVFPVIVGNQQTATDLGIERVICTQSNFETAPVHIEAELISHGMAGKTAVVRLLDEKGETLEKRQIVDLEDERRFKVRFQTKPQKKGINVYQVEAHLADDDPSPMSLIESPEATLINNRQTIVVNRGRGPYRILYVCGRPNWEMKFLNRALKDDLEVSLVSLVRIAKREARFVFRGKSGQQSNSLFRGFNSQDEDTTEQHDEPVFLRLGTKDGDELRGGFPKDPESLFAYDGIILDDVEADFFNEDQKGLVQDFVASRGGGLLMLGGQESFASGRYAQTPIGEMMPVYLDRLAPATRQVEYQLALTREGWLEPWVRVRSTEQAEKVRLAMMPTFRTINRTNSIKPGASVLATVSGGSRKDIPALVVQPFGTGRVGAVLIGDFWRWHMRTELANDDQFKAWRQTVRWLVGDVPRRVELQVEPDPAAPASQLIRVQVRNERYLPYDNAKVDLTVVTPGGSDIKLSTATTKEPGVYVSRFAASQPGVYRAIAKVENEDGSEIETRETGWVCDPDRDEFRSLLPNRALLQEIADRSGGKLLTLSELDSLPDQLECRPVPIMQQQSLPWWHRWFVLAGALTLLIGEWGIRRWKGMP